MNKQLERDLQCSIQSLKAGQLANVLAHYEEISGGASQKLISKKGVSFECQIIFKGQSSKGYGRNQQESISNATKNLLSILVSKNMDIDKIKSSLKYKNETQNLQSMNSTKKQNKEKDISILLDDISMIQPNPRAEIFPETHINQPRQSSHKKKNSCDCVFFDMQRYQQNEIKHLQARVNLLTQQNTLLKKMLLYGNGSSRQPIDLIQKQNSSMQSNSINIEGKLKF